MIKFAVLLLFVSIVYCSSVKQQESQERRDEPEVLNPFLRPRQIDAAESNREWMRIQLHRQRMRELQQKRYLARLLEGYEAESEQENNEKEPRTEKDGSDEADRAVQPGYWPAYDSPYVYPWSRGGYRRPVYYV